MIEPWMVALLTWVVRFVIVLWMLALLVMAVRWVARGHSHGGRGGVSAPAPRPAVAHPEPECPHKNVMPVEATLGTELDPKVEVVAGLCTDCWDQIPEPVWRLRTGRTVTPADFNRLPTPEELERRTAALRASAERADWPTVPAVPRVRP